jgi:hypothetical protein
MLPQPTAMRQNVGLAQQRGADRSFRLRPAASWDFLTVHAISRGVA